MVAFAVALNFITSFALQGALKTPSRTTSNSATITVPMAPALDPGFSAQISTNGTIDRRAYNWEWIWMQVQNVVGSTTAEYTYFGSLDDNGDPFNFGYEENATYVAYVDGAGFEYDCQPYQTAYDLLPTTTRQHTQGRIFQSYFFWNSTRPNETIFDIFWKGDEPCRGNNTGRHCVLRPATVTYPISIFMKVPGIAYQGPFLKLQTGTTRHDDKTKVILQPYPSEGLDHTTYGGIAQSLNDSFNAHIDIVDTYYDDVNSSYTTYGSFSDSMNTNYTEDADYYCQVSFDAALSNFKFLTSLSQPNQTLADKEGDGAYFDGSVDLAEIVLTRVRQAIFISTVYTGTQALSTNWNGRENSWLPFDQTYYLPQVEATKQLQETVYDFRWYLWAISAAVTWTASVLVLLSFGKWPGLLRTERSLAPLETAQFFDAPALRDIPSNDGVDEILEHLGDQLVR